MSSCLSDNLDAVVKVDFSYDLTDIEKAAWTQFWLECGHSHPRQHLDSAEIERAKKRTPIFASAKANGKLVCIAIFSIRPLWGAKSFSFEAVCLRGPACDDMKYLKQFLAEAVRKFKAMRVGSVRVSPYWIFPEADSVVSVLDELNFVPHRGPNFARDHTGLIDVCHDDDGILASFSKDTRRHVRRAQKNNFIVRPASTLDEAEMFFKEINLLARERNFRMLPEREYRVMFQKTFREQENGIILNVYMDSVFLGGLSLTRSEHTAHTLHFAVAKKSLGKLSNVRIAPIVWLYGLRWARDHGCKWVDVEGYREGADEVHFHHNIYAYKRGFRPQAVQRISEYKYVCNPFVSMLHSVFIFISRKTRVLLSLPYHIGIRIKSRKALRQLSKKTVN